MQPTDMESSLEQPFGRAVAGQAQVAMSGGKYGDGLD